MQTNNKLREALETLVDVVEAWQDHLPSAIREGEVSAALDKANAALAEPVRNCEVGTLEEQAFRFAEFCDSWKVVDDMTECDKCNGDCPLIGMDGECKLAWAQMPYEEGVPNAEQKEKIC